jgi:hypothetical protein
MSMEPEAFIDEAAVIDHIEYGGRHDLITASTVTGIIGQAGRPHGETRLQ